MKVSVEPGFNVIALVIYRRDLLPDDEGHVVEVRPLAQLEARKDSPALLRAMKELWAKYEKASKRYRLEAIQ